MLLRSLPKSYKNFLCAISSLADLQSLETLRIKIEMEFDARRNASKKFVPSAIIVKKLENRRCQNSENRNWKSEKDDTPKKYF